MAFPTVVGDGNDPDGFVETVGGEGTLLGVEKSYVPEEKEFIEREKVCAQAGGRNGGTAVASGYCQKIAFIDGLQEHLVVGLVLVRGQRLRVPGSLSLIMSQSRWGLTLGPGSCRI